jgi:hypothetical protein
MNRAQRDELLKMTGEQLVELFCLANEAQEAATRSVLRMTDLLSQADAKLQEQASTISSLESKVIELEARWASQ